MDRAALELKSSAVDKVTFYLFTCMSFCQLGYRITSWQHGWNRSDVLKRSWAKILLDHPVWIRHGLYTMGIFFFLPEPMTWMGHKYIINHKTHFTVQATKNVFSGEILVNLNLCVPWYLGEFVFRAVLELGSEMDQPSLGNLTTLGVRSLSLLKKRLRTCW